MVRHIFHCGQHHSANDRPCPLHANHMQVAMLYLRYVCEPKVLWDWCGNYIADTEVSGEFHTQLHFVTMSTHILYCCFHTTCLPCCPSLIDIPLRLSLQGSTVMYVESSRQGQVYHWNRGSWFLEGTARHFCSAFACKLTSSKESQSTSQRFGRCAGVLLVWVDLSVLSVIFMLVCKYIAQPSTSATHQSLRDHAKTFGNRSSLCAV